MTGRENQVLTQVTLILHAGVVKKLKKDRNKSATYKKFEYRTRLAANITLVKPRNQTNNVSMVLII